MTVLVMDVRLQDAADRLGMEMCGEGLKIAALRLCEALLFQEPRSATPTGALVRDVCSMIARCTPAVAERGARLLMRLLQENSSWAQLSVLPISATGLPQKQRFTLNNSTCRVHTSTNNTPVCQNSQSPVWPDAREVLVPLEALQRRVLVEVWHR